MMWWIIWSFLVTLNTRGGTETIVKPGPSSGIMIQETPGFIVTDRRRKTQKVCLSVDPQPSTEKRFDIKSIQLPEIKIWYEIHVTRTQNLIEEVLIQAHKPLISVSIPHRQRPKRLPGALIVGTVLTVLGIMVAIGLSVVNSVSTKSLETEMNTLRWTMNIIHKPLQTQGNGLLDLTTIVNGFVITIISQSRPDTSPINFQQTYKLSQKELLPIQEPTQSFSVSFINENQYGKGYLNHGRIPLHFVFNNMIRTLLTKETDNVVTDFQVNLTFEKGSAMPFYFSPKYTTVCSLLVPYISSLHIYQLKNIHPYGTSRDILCPYK